MERQEKMNEQTSTLLIRRVQNGFIVDINSGFSAVAGSQYVYNDVKGLQAEIPKLLGAAVNEEVDRECPPLPINSFIPTVTLGDNLKPPQS